MNAVVTHLSLLLAALVVLPGAVALAEESDPKEIVKAHFSSVALIEGDLGSGTGFIVTEGETTRLYTAAHVLSGNKRLSVKNVDGREFRKFGTFEVASDSDLARIELREKFESTLKFAPEGSVKVNDPVLAIGNSGGAGVLTVLDGKAVSLGPDTIELSNGVIQGNSGGPIFSGKSGEVLGVVTHALAARDDIWAKDTNFAEVRRFATRLDRKITWEKMPIGRFLAEAGRIEEFNRNTRILFAISALDPTQDGLRLDTAVVAEGQTVLGIFGENEDVPVVADLIEMNSKLGSANMRTSPDDLRKRFSRYYGDALRQLDRDSDKFVADRFSGYNRPAAKQASKWRVDARKAVNRAASRLR